MITNGHIVGNSIVLLVSSLKVAIEGQLTLMYTRLKDRLRPVLTR